VADLGGRKSLYSTSFYTREQFYEIYGGGEYARLKARYDPQGRFAGLYEKTCLEGS
jgi:FAD/FMN-containing dehydrogenase